jgi:methionyl-tRNA formyltransferase
MKRIVVLGNKNLAVGCTAHLLGLQERVVAVVLNPDDEGRDQHGYLSLKRFAKDQGLPAYQPGSASEPGFVEMLEGLEPDLLFSFSYSRILRRNLLDRFPDRVFNIHFSLLPRNRGCLPLVYALAEGEREAGVTIHLVDEGIDTGDIVSRQSLPVTASDTARSLYFRATAAGVSLFAETYPLLRDGRFKRIPQGEEGATAHPQQNPNDRWVDPSWNPEAIHRFIRAHTFWPPYPGARLLHEGTSWELRYAHADRFLASDGKNSVEMSLDDLLKRFMGARSR